MLLEKNNFFVVRRWLKFEKNMKKNYFIYKKLKLFSFYLSKIKKSSLFIFIYTWKLSLKPNFLKYIGISQFKKDKIIYRSNVGKIFFYNLLIPNNFSKSKNSKWNYQKINFL
jgi:hypothetical protein